MPSSYTTSLRLTLPATGELAGTWGSTVNTGITELLDAAVAGTASISTWGGPGVAYTLSNNSGTADEARRMFIVATGTPGEAKNVICPAVSKFYVFRNDTTGGFALTLKTSGGTGISVPAGQYKFLYCDGTNVVEMFNSVGALTLGTALAASSGGTGQSTYAVGDLVYATGATSLSKLNIGASTTILTSSGTAPQWSTASSVTIGTATNLAGGLGGSVPYQSGAGATTFLGIGAANTVLTSSGTAPQWSTALTGLTGVSTTTATLSSDLTLNAGTANGVVFLNASKVATSGSALVFTGTNLGIGNNATNAKLEVTASTGEVFRADASGGSFRIVANQTDVLLQGTTSVQGWINGSEQMRLTSTGLGIGTSSPVAKLDVNGALNLAVGNNLTWGGAYGAGTPTIAGSSTGGGTLLFYPAGSTSGESMRLDPAGNLGLGVPPSAWGAAFKALQVGRGSFASDISSSTTINTYFGANLVNDGALKYIVNNFATLYQQDAGQHRFFTAPSGTAGNAISFTQAMTLDADGDLGLGTTSPSVSDFTSGALGMHIKGSSNYGVLKLESSDNKITWLATGSAATYLYVKDANPLVFGTNNTERARIDSSGNLLVGGTAALYGAAGRGLVQVSGSSQALLGFGTTGNVGLGFLYHTGTNFELTNSQNGFLSFGTNNTERARITSGGYFKASNAGTYAGGATSAAHEFDQNSTSLASLYVYSTANATGNYGINVGYPNRTPNDTGNEFLICGDSTATRATIRSNGGLANYSANDANLSDRREKTNFAPAKPYLDTICAIPVQTFNYIDQSEDDPGLTLGVVAQDVQAVAPELVMESNWGTADEPKQRLSIYQTDLQYALMKCVQELKAQNDELRARVAALESN